MRSAVTRVSTIFIILVLFTGIVALACTGMEAGTPAIETPFRPEPLDDIVAGAAALLASLIGIPAVLAATLAILEKAGRLTPEQSDIIQSYANIALYLIAFGFVFFGKTHLLQSLDYYLEGIAPILAALLLFISGGIKSIIHSDEAVCREAATTGRSIRRGELGRAGTPQVLYY
jgi:hypothetical protein